MATVTVNDSNIYISGVELYPNPVNTGGSCKLSIETADCIPVLGSKINAYEIPNPIAYNCSVQSKEVNSTQNITFTITSICATYSNLQAHLYFDISNFLLHKDEDLNVIARVTNDTGVLIAVNWRLAEDMDSYGIELGSATTLLNTTCDTDSQVVMSETLDDSEYKDYKYLRLRLNARYYSSSPIPANGTVDISLITNTSDEMYVLADSDGALLGTK